MGSWLSRLFRYLWASPTTIVGLVLAFAMLRRGRATIVDGVIEAHSPLLGRALCRLTPLAGGAAAITLGHVVLGRNAAALEMTRAHERVHVRQYEMWGPFFVPAYVAAGLYALAKGRHPYFDNRFEREAYARDPVQASDSGLPAESSPSDSSDSQRFRCSVRC